MRKSLTGYLLATEDELDFMRVSNQIALLMRMACKISDSEPAHKTARFNNIDRSNLEILNLSRFELNEIYERANFVNEKCSEAPEYVGELVY